MQRFFGLILLIFTTILMHAADVPDVGPFYGQRAEFIGYDRDSNPVFCIGDIALVNLKGDCITVTGATIDTANSYSPRGICIRDDFAVAYLPLDSLKWNTGITLDLTGWGTIDYQPFCKRTITDSQIKLAVPGFTDNLLRQNILYWLSEVLASEATWYMEDNIDWDFYFEMGDAYVMPAQEDICFIPSLYTSSQEICDYYGDFLINLFKIPKKKRNNDDDDINPYFGGQFTAGTKILSESDSLITIEFYCDSNFGGGSGNGDNRHPIATFDKKTGRRLILPDIFDFSRRAEIAKVINRCLYNSPDWNLSEKIPASELLSMPFGLCSDTLRFIISRHTFLGVGGTLDIPLVEFGDAVNNHIERHKWETLPATAGIKYCRPYKLKEIFDPDLSDHGRLPKQFPTKKFLKQHPFRKQEHDMAVIEAATTINGGNNRILGEHYRNSGENGKAEEILDILALAGYNGPMNSGSDELAKLLDIKHSIVDSLLARHLYDKADIKARDFLWLAQDSTYIYRDGKPAMADGLVLYSTVSREKGDLTASVQAAIEGGGILLPYITDTSVRLSSSKRRELWDYYKDWCMGALPDLAFHSNDSTLKRMSYDAILNGKGMLLNTENAVRRAIVESGDDRLTGLLKDIDRLSRELEALIQKGPEPSDDPDRRMECLQSFRTQKDSLNTLINTSRNRLAHNSSEYARYLRGYTASSRQVCGNLAEGEVAVEFVVADTDYDTAYYALVMHKGNPVPDIVKIGDAATVYGPLFSAIDSESSITDGSIFRHIWEPIAGILSPTETDVYFSPDGSLYTTPVEYSVPADGHSPLRFHRLSSTREIAFRNDSTGILKGEAVIFGGLDYDDCNTQNVRTKTDGNNRDFLRSYILNRRSGISPLPFSMDEVKEIETSLRHTKTIDNVLAYTGADGSESAFKRCVSSASRIVHVATHGFYLSEDEYEEFRGTDIFRNFSKDLDDIEDGELYRSALLFAGINRVFSGDGQEVPDGEDGILTAKEISMMNMSNVDLAVLSACQSGLGDISSEGVSGLQRGLKKAGANTILATLWKVDDEATKLFMSEFYHRLSQGQSKSAALTAAQGFIKRYGNGRYRNPFYWAPFILIDALGSTSYSSRPR